MENQNSDALTRRCWLRGVGMAIGAGAVLQFFKVDSFAFAEDPINRIIAQWVASSNPGNLFITDGDGGNWVEPIRLQSPVDSLVNIYGELGLEPRFSYRPSFREASQCTKYFKREEARWRYQYNNFTDVKRAPADYDVAYMLAGNFDSSRGLYSAEGATQFQDAPSVTLANDDPAVTLAHSVLLRGIHGMGRTETAQSLAVTEKGSVVDGNEIVGTSYETPVTQFVHIRRPPRNSRARRWSRGILAARSRRSPATPNSVYQAGLYV